MTGSRATLIISSRNYSSWSLRGWLLMRLSGLDFDLKILAQDDPQARAELLSQTSSIRIPSLRHDGIEMWDVMAIAEYLHELLPGAGLYPADRRSRALCRSVSAEMHSGFTALRSALPVNLNASRPDFPIWSGARADIGRLSAIFEMCIAQSGGPFLFGPGMTVADAMFAPVCTRFVTYGVALDRVTGIYRDHIMARPELTEWIAGAREEPDLVSELEVEGEF